MYPLSEDLQSIRLCQQQRQLGARTPLRGVLMLAHCTQSTLFSVSPPLVVPGPRGLEATLYAPNEINWERGRPYLGENPTSSGSRLSSDHHGWGIPPRLCSLFTSEKKGNDAHVRVVPFEGWQAAM